MALYLVQHGVSRPKSEDPEQGLSEAGVAQTRRVAAWAAARQIAVNAIHHSGKTRARRTAELLAAALSPPEGVQEAPGLAPLDDPAPAAAAADPARQLMIVGHLPFLSRLAALLVAGRAEPAIVQFRNSGIVCLDKPPESPNWQIQWILTPHTC